MTHIRTAIVLLGSAALSGLLPAAEYPQAKISNGVIRATINLPDAQKGYYHATRYDWSGVIELLECKGHKYFEPFYDRFDPKVADVDLSNGVAAGPASAVTGPVEEFNNAGGAPLGYADAKPGGTFVKIGVGVLRKPDEPKYDHYRVYEIVDSGKWTVKPHADSVEFTQALRDASTGYGYLYKKTVRLVKGQPEMVLEHSLKNTGTKVIDGTVYDHNFLRMDHQIVGPDIVLQFPFEIKAGRPNQYLAIEKNSIRYLKTLGNDEIASTTVQGFSASPKDFDIRVENRKTGAGVRITADTPMARFMLWSMMTVVSPEAFISYHIEPGSEQKWNITYQFYTLPNTDK